MKQVVLQEHLLYEPNTACDSICRMSASTQPRIPATLSVSRPATCQRLCWLSKPHCQHHAPDCIGNTSLVLTLSTLQRRSTTLRISDKTSAGYELFMATK
jgi:hypothetical protein